MYPNAIWPLVWRGGMVTERDDDLGKLWATDENDKIDDMEATTPLAALN